MIPYKLQIAILHTDMAAPANFTVTAVRQQKTLEDLICSLDLTRGLQGQVKFISVLNSIMSVTAFLGNALILIALHKESSIHPPSKLLLRNLATTDLCVGLIAEPLTVIYWMSQVNKQWNICRYAVIAQFITNYTLCGVSVGTLTAISVDRLLALLLGLRYRPFVTLKRTRLCARYYLLDCLYCRFSNAILESPSGIVVWYHSYISLSSNLDLFLHKNFLHPPSSSKSNTRACSTTEPNKSTEHSAIQKRSVHCNMAATDDGRLSFTV